MEAQQGQPRQDDSNMESQLEDSFVIKFRMSDIGRSALKIEERSELVEEIHQKVTAIISEGDVQGLQLYPQKWPKTVHLVLKNETVKNQLLVEGLNIFGNNVNLQDDSLSAITKVMVYDVPIDMSNERLKDIFSKYGDVIQVDDEKHKVNGRMTSWDTGNKIVSMSSVKIHIPPHMTGPHRGQNVSINTWYRGQDRFIAPNAATRIEKCIKCGLTSHVTENCPEKRKVCYNCKQPGHMNADCPNSQKSGKVSVIENDDVLCFLGENCVFSNLNTEYPVEIDGISYICNEQYIQCAKASMFGDDESVEKIMKTDNPHEIRNLGKNISGFYYWEWRQKVMSFMKKCMRQKFMNQLGAQRVLLRTGNKIIAEASRDTYWGSGTHITNESALDMEAWEGKNKMGEILMGIRNEIQQLAGTGEQTLDITNEFCQNDSMSNVDISHAMQDENGDEQVNMCTDEDGDVDGDDDSCEDGDDDGGSHGDGDSSSEGNGDDDDGDGEGDDDGEGDGDDDGDDYIDDNGDDSSDGDEIAEDDNKGAGEIMDIDDDHDDDSIVLSNNTSDNENDESDTKEDANRMGEKYVILIGDSNCRDVLLNVPYKIERQVASGTAIFDIESVITDSLLPANQVSAIIVHIGTCDFDPGKINNTSAMYSEYVEGISSITNTYPDADVLISSILPRVPCTNKSFDGLNAEIMDLNNRLCKLENDAPHIMFMDNYCDFMTNDCIRKELYLDRDKTGVLINAKGAETLTNNFLKGLQEIHYKRKLRYEYNVVPKALS